MKKTVGVWSPNPNDLIPLQPKFIVLTKRASSAIL